MTKSNTLPMALAILGLGAASAFAEIKVGDNLSLTGFIDMSASGTAPDSGDATLNSSFDQFELDFMYKFGDKVSARVDLNSLGGGAMAFEQGFVTYAAGGVGFSAGRFLSSSGFEAAEPTGMYQYSYSKQLVYGGYQNGANFNYGTDKFGLYGAVVTDLWNASETDLTTPGFEGQLSLKPTEAITAKVAYLYQMYDEDATGDASQQLLNSWAQYAAGPITIAAEYDLLIDWVVSSTENDGMGHGWLAMANYKFAPNFAATVRYSGLILGDGDPDTEITFSPSVALKENWGALAEVKYEIDAKATDYAVETTLSF